MTFPKIRMLTVMITPLSTQSHPYDCKSSPKRFEANIRAFVQHVKHIVPLMTKIHVRMAFDTTDMPQNADRN
ncbi:hypothetical protein IWW38_004372, partial [Coemansia aciculifera]